MDTALFEGTLVESERILYTPSTFARTNLIHLQECGRLKALSPHTSHRENLASYLCFIVLEGSGTLEYDQKHYTLSAGDCVFLDCNKSYLHRCSCLLYTSCAPTNSRYIQKYNHIITTMIVERLPYTPKSLNCSMYTENPQENRFQLIAVNNAPGNCFVSFSFTFGT